MLAEKKEWEEAPYRQTSRSALAWRNRDGHTACGDEERRQGAGFPSGRRDSVGDVPRLKPRAVDRRTFRMGCVAAGGVDEKYKCIIVAFSAMHVFHHTSMNIPVSRLRSLVRDVSRGLGQQMFFWGCDVRHPGGNLLTRAGMERIARRERGGEGSSRYRIEWGGGTVELHSYCCGWYGAVPPYDGAIFIRRLERVVASVGPIPPTPGVYESERMAASGADQLLRSVRPLVRWVVDYEDRLGELAGEQYRRECWRRARSGAGARPWLAPRAARDWFRSFLDDPCRTRRPREIIKQEGALN